MIELFTIDVKCGLCQAKIGENVVSSEFGWTREKAKAEALGFIDVRCNSCEATHGSFKEMVETYVKDAEASYLDAENFVKQNRKKGDFEIAFKPIRDAVIERKEKEREKLKPVPSPEDAGSANLE